MKKIIKQTNFILLLNIFLIISFCFSQQYKIQEAEEKEILLQEIEVKEGQTLSQIANYYLKDPRQWPEILKYNKLNISDIYAPLPGMKIKVPVVIVKEKFRPAYLVYILNKVKYRKRDSVIWEDPVINMELYNDDAVSTQENSRANIKFYSGEILTIDENSFLTIRPELKQEEVTLHKGGVRATTAKVITDSAEILPKIDPKLPKTDFRTKVREEDKTTLVEVYEGAVDVTAQGKTVYVPKGFGTEVKFLSPPSEPKVLPPPPELTFNPQNVKLSKDNELVLSKSASVLSFELKLPQQVEQKESLPFITEKQQKPTVSETKEKISTKQEEKTKVLGQIIKKYHIQIAKDKDFKKIVYEETNELKPDQTINFDLTKMQLPDGKYYYKISYIDELGFENPAVPQPIVIDTTPPKLETNLVNITKTDKDLVEFSGTTEPDIFLTINNNNVDITKDGKFNHSVVLKPGINKIIIVAKDLYGNETKIEHQIEFVKQLTKEEKEKLQEQQKISKEKKGWSLGTIFATAVSSAVIILVLFFFIK
jgi:hypothetical protein